MALNTIPENYGGYQRLRRCQTDGVGLHFLAAMPDSDSPPTRPFYAVDIWLLADGKMGSKVDVNVGKFEEVLQEANEIAITVLDNPFSVN